MKKPVKKSSGKNAQSKKAKPLPLTREEIRALLHANATKKGDVRKAVDEESAALIFYDELPTGWEQHLPEATTKEENRDLNTRIHYDILELLLRAENKDRDALGKLVILARNLCNEVDLLARKQPEFVAEEAKTWDEWPVTVSLIDINKAAHPRAVPFLRNTLMLGADAFVRVDRRRMINLDPEKGRWNRYAWFALKAMRFNKDWVADARERYKGCRSGRVAFPLGRRKLSGTFYQLTDGMALISEHAEQCVSLPDRLTAKNVKQFWQPMKAFILEYWDTSTPKGQEPSDFEHVRGETEGQRREAALEAIEQALEVIAGK